MPSPIVAAGNKWRVKIKWVLFSAVDPPENTLILLDGITRADNQLKVLNMEEKRYMSDTGGYATNIPTYLSGKLNLDLDVCNYDPGFQELQSHLGPDQPISGYELFVIYEEEGVETATGRFVANFNRTADAAGVSSGTLELSAVEAPVFTSDLPDLTPP